MLKVILVPIIKIAFLKISVKSQIFSFVNCFYILISEVLHLYVVLLLWLCKLLTLWLIKQNSFKINIEIVRLCLPDYIVIKANKLNNLKSVIL